MKYCSQCGSSIIQTVPKGDNRQRHVCIDDQCGEIHYQNPRIITGCLAFYGSKVLLCRRAIDPRYGYWTLPAGFMENGETTEEGALRESWEEARATLQIESIYRIFNLPHINQVYFFYRANLSDLNFSPGDESLDVQLFTEEDIPWDELAFEVVNVTLRDALADLKTGDFPFSSAVIQRKLT